MAAHHHHDKIGLTETVLVWLPVGALILSGFIVPHVGPVELLIACAGWANLVAVVAIAREIRRFPEKNLSVVLRAGVFFITVLLFLIILSWDLTLILKDNKLVIVISFVIGVFVLFVIAVLWSSNRIHIQGQPFIFLVLGIFVILIFGFCLFNIDNFVNGLADNWLDDDKMKNRIHVWVHLLGIPIIYLLTDFAQFCLVPSKDKKDKKKFKAFCGYDFILLAVGFGFAVIGWYADLPLTYETQNGADPVSDPKVLASTTKALRLEEVAAAAILVLWNIAYVHLYPHPDAAVYQDGTNKI